MSWLLLAAVVAAAAYQAAALAAVLRHLFRLPAPAGFRPPVSVLKPVHGCDPHLAASLRSHAGQSYPEFELLFGVNDPADSALPEIARLQAEFPQVNIRVVVSGTPAPTPRWGC